jgi:glycosyltransferase involved in cell wall biosynthesis
MACAAFPPFIDGGGPISAMMVAKLLLESGHDVQVVNVDGEERFEVFEGVPVRRLNTLNIDWNYRLPRPAWKKLVWHALENFNPRAFAVMRREIRRFQPDLVLTDSIENINVATWLAAKTLHVPVCHILRSTFLLCWKGSMHNGTANCDSACTSCQASSVGKKLMSRYVDAVIGETDFIIGRHLEHGYFPNAVSHKIPGAIEQLVVPAPAPRGAGLPIRFGFIGVHTPVKGLETLARAARRLADNKAARFVIAGSGDEAFTDYVSRVFPAETTRFLGWTKPDDFFPQIDVLVVPSLFREPFGRVVIEAFAHGVPVIGARSGGIPESIDIDVNGMLFTPDDDAELAELMADIAADPQSIARLSAGALESARSYLKDQIANAYTTVLAQTLSQAQKPVLQTAGEPSL